mgnify:FL=1
MYCLPKELSKKLLDAIKSGKIIPEKLIEMSSEERRAFFEKTIGKEYARDVNAKLEAKILLKDQKRGMVTWSKKLNVISEQTRRDLISRIERMDKVLEPKSEKAFLEDLVSKKLGADITFEEAKNISTGIKEVVRLKEAIPEDSPIRSRERLEYGTAEVLFRDYIDSLKKKDARSLSKKVKEFLTSPEKIVIEVAGATKSLLASLDNSYFGRQGIKILYTNPSLWAKNFIKSWGDIGKSLFGRDVMSVIKADVLSRENALNRKYEVGKYDLGIKFEEAFPSSLPERIPLFGRFFKAAETAFNGGALRMRADLADKMIGRAESQGIDVLDPIQAVPIGKLVNSMTGRGGIGKLEIVGKELNVLLFSIKFLKSNIDFLTAHLFDKTMSPFAKKQAAYNLGKAVAATSAILWTANQLWPGSVDTDPRSANFGKIRIGDTRFDVSGGMASLITLASRITPTLHDGEWGFWTKSSITGKYTKLNSGKWGSMTVMDIIDNYWQGKLSPLAGLFRDVARGQNFQGDKPTVGNVALNLITPIPIQTFFELKNNPESADLLLSMILEGLGISANTYSKK